MTAHDSVNQITDTDTAWVPEPRDIPTELEPNYNHADYVAPPTITERITGVPLADRIDDTMRNRLKELGYL